MIDLHMHTTASDGTFSPEALVARVERAGIRIFSVTDHDTMASVDAATRLAADRRLTCVPGIEITSVADGHDVHLLGYFLDASFPRLATLLAQIRAQRVERAAEISARLAAAGVPVDVDALIAGSRSPRSIA